MRDLMSSTDRIVGFHASHEQHTPRDLLACVKRADSAGFNGAMCSDHFHPWTEQQGQSGYTWSWLGAALEATSFSLGTVCAPGWRYHPAVIAQAAATLSQMYPSRFWFAVGSGEALNEHITGEQWPDEKHARNAKLLECVDIMRALWRGETVHHRGAVVVEDAKLYTRPAEPPLLFCAALSEETAEWAGSWADGLMTTARPRDELIAMIEAFRRGGGDGKPIRLQAVVSYAATETDAKRAARREWGPLAIDSDLLTTLRTPADFERAGRTVTDDDVARTVRISADPARYVEWLESDFAAGVEAVYIMNVGRNQHEFIDVFSERVLPAVL
jgi:coenzyme F420-dependent glucose-6-phosphate dehydrogenase